MTSIYGINNCDTVKKAIKWLDKNNISYVFHDFKKQGLTNELLSSFVQNSEWKLLINKRSTTFRNLSDAVKENLSDNIDNDVAFDTIFEQPTLLKRPVLIHNHQLHLGFKEQQYLEIFSDELNF
ncbi:MAG: Spx/MgsR family RNA polymerase-binding regulatory protein [Alteromonadaceae bacterium]|nr:Spx/MgsR family RNA polymerase-binding regulatory protein [Alteromonadaceae bacterium]